MKEKLTYYQICQLVAQGRQVPEGYHIKYVNNQPPQTVLKATLNSNLLTYQRNNFPVPDLMEISGAYVVIMPQFNLDEDDPLYFEEKQEFGDVLIRTRFELNDIRFLYKLDKQQEICSIFNDLTGRFVFAKKEDYTFDANIKLPFETINLKNLMPVNVQYNDASKQSDNEFISVEFNYDYYINEF